MADKPDDFDEIVQNLDLDLSFPDDPREPQHPSVRHHRRPDLHPEAGAEDEEPE